jgi:hypothetical protein
MPDSSRWLTQTKAATSALVRIKVSSGTLIVVDFLSPQPMCDGRQLVCLIKTPNQMREENEIAFANLRQLVERMRRRTLARGYRSRRP